MIREQFSLEGRIALVAGGAGKLGVKITEALVELGATPVIVDNQRVKQEFKGLDGVVDLTDRPSVDQLASQVEKQFGKLDIVVHAAALTTTSLPQDGWSGPFEEQSWEIWQKALDVNLTSAFHLAQAMTPLLRRSNHASIIHIGSIYGLVGPDWRLYEGSNFGNPAAYAASKGGLLQFTRWLATTLAPQIRVNAVTPGGIERGHSKTFVSKYQQRTPLGRMATEKDIVGTVAFLASDLSSYITGQNLVVDGGWTAW